MFIAAKDPQSRLSPQAFFLPERSEPVQR